MRHFIKKHKHHFGLWALSGIILIASVAWQARLKSENRFEAPEKNDGDASFAPHIDLANKASSSADTASVQPVFDASPRASSTAAEKNNAKFLQDNSLPPRMSAQGADFLSPSQENNTPVDFVIAFPQETRTLKLNVPKESTVYDAMKILSRAYNLDVQFKEFSGLGAMVQSIGGVESDTHANTFWIYYINGSLAKAGISSVKINSHDVIKWNYEAGKE